MSVEVEGDASPDVLRCTVCLEDYRPYGPLKPRILPVCLHTFCEGCLEKLGVDNAYSISCPICRVFNDVFGKDGIQALPINTRVPFYETIEEETEEADIFTFIDPSIPSCPMCGSITLFAPFGLDADITQCHTCQWVSVEVMEYEETVLPAPSTVEIHIDNTVQGARTKGSACQNGGPQCRKRKTLGGRLMSYLRKRFPPSR
ncbi:tripartite motif-containing protein 2-like [Dendropsophus ebraccatus]|uniref:tripartite motif-containing protein 2-like n=1 Tax=Dendropsophus ebraccatus TaxID=150705 RepID=UPI00383217A2